MTCLEPHGHQRAEPAGIPGISAPNWPWALRQAVGGGCQQECCLSSAQPPLPDLPGPQCPGSNLSRLISGCFPASCTCSAPCDFMNIILSHTCRPLPSVYSSLPVYLRLAHFPPTPSYQFAGFSSMKLPREPAHTTIPSHAFYPSLCTCFCPCKKHLICTIKFLYMVSPATRPQTSCK